MAAKKVVKKASTKKNKVTDIPIGGGNRISVDMKKVENGFVVSTYCQKTGKDKTYVAKTIKEAQDYAKGMLKID
jgi:hypothetical protein